MNWMYYPFKGNIFFLTIMVLFLVWVFGSISSAQDSYEKIREMVIDKSGNVYVTGNTWAIMGSSFGFSDFITIKYDSKGNEEWVARYNGPGDGADGVQSLKIDKKGNVYVSGNSLNLSGDFDFVTI